MSKLELPVPQLGPRSCQDLKVIIVRKDNVKDEGVLELTRWCQFHHLETSLADHFHIRSLKGKALIMTDDLRPSEQVPLSVVKELEVCSTITFSTDAYSKWVPSVILLCNFETSVTGTISEIVQQALNTGRVQHRPSLVESEIETEVSKLNHRMFEDNNEEERYHILSQVLVRYWYDLDHLIVARYYSHAWIHSYQRLSCLSLDIDGIPSSKWRDQYDWVRQQSPFGASFELKQVQGNTKQAVAALVHSKVRLGSRLEGLEFKVQEDISRLQRHPLTLPGLVRLIPEQPCHSYDTTITMVGFYYQLGYASKPKEDYLKSLDKYLTIRHPLVFYGDSEICQYVSERRDPLFTKVINKPVEEWELISQNLSLFNDTSSAYQMAKSPRYALLTNCKTFAVTEAIRINPFNSSHFVWHDPGFYRHGYMAEGLPLSYPIFSKLEILEGKITMPSLTTVASITDEQYDQAGETLIAYVMAGDIQAWKIFHQECARLLETKLADNKVLTEQCLHTRIATLRPEIFNLHFSNYAPFNINRFLGLNVDYSSYVPVSTELENLP